ncbi:MAG: PLP-dependent aminotransferase family protein [Roseiflexaceae bacterium]|jgi:2-aminoadipate transaminase|nr:PLP-dependent aminotransferase family protein [Chloroflexaceae bacterium]
MSSGTGLSLDALFATRAKAFREGPDWAPEPEGTISLSYGFADPEHFPVAEIIEATAEVLAEDVNGALNYGPTYPGLVRLVVDRLKTRGVAHAAPSNVMISYGSSQILALLPQIMVDPGDVVIVEGPCFMGAVRSFQEAGAKIETVPVRADGMDIDILAQLLADLTQQGIRPKFIYTTPTYQNPTGTLMPLANRKRLVALAAQYGVLILEDDAYGDLRFEGEALPKLIALDTDGWVLNCGTFSKILAPGVRMAWACGPEAIIKRLQKFKVEGSSGPFLTRMVERFAADGRLDAHIAELNENYRHKRDVMLAAIARELPADVTYTVPQGGFFIYLYLPADMPAAAVLAKGRECGVTALSGVGCYANGQGANEMRLAFSYQPEDKLVEGIRRLGAAMKAARSQ